MKRMLAICLLLVLPAVCAFAQEEMFIPRVGFAVVMPNQPEDGGTACLHAAADRDSDVIMRYYSGARVEVVEIEEDGAFARVICGEPGAMLSGYMHTEELAYGELAAREIPLCYEAVQFLRDVPIYSYCDARGAVIGTAMSTRFYAICGRNDNGMAQLFEQSGAPDKEFGFVNIHAPMLYRDFENDPHTYAVPPLAGELTRVEAYERAIACLLDGGADTYKFMDKLPEHLRSEKGLRSMDADIRLWKQDGSVMWHIMLTDPENMDNNISVTLSPEGEPDEVSRANG